MSGNVCEWCWNRESKSSSRHVLCGGCYDDLNAEDCAVSAHRYSKPDTKNKSYGFRVVREIQ